MTRWAFCANLVAYWLIGAPTAYVFGFVLDWGTSGFWWGLTLALLLAAVLLTRKFLSVSRTAIAPVE